MNIKVFFKQVYAQESLLRAKEVELRIAHRDIESLKSTLGPKESLTGGGELSGKLTQVERYERRVKREMDRLYAMKDRAKTLINQLENPEEKTVMTYRYLNHMKWEEVCIHANISWRNMHRKHASAIAKLNQKKLA